MHRHVEVASMISERNSISVAATQLWQTALRAALIAAGIAFLAAMIPEVAAQESPATPGSLQKKAPDPAFDILEFRVEGNTVFDVRVIESTVSPFLGLHRHFADVEAARRALESKYQRAGFQTVFVEIPEQKISAGVVRLRVLEARIGSRSVNGAKYFAPDDIRLGASELAPGKIPQFDTMQQELGALNRNSDRQIAPTLTAGKTPGTVDVNLSVKESAPLHGQLEIDNHASPFTSATRANAAIHYDNLWQRQDSIGLNYQVAPQKPSEANVLYASYLMHMAARDDVISFYAVRSNSNIAVVGSSTILGKAKIAGLRWIKPLPTISADAGFFHNVSLGFDRKDFAQTNISAVNNSLTVLPPITYVPLSATYSGGLVSQTSTTTFSLGALSAPRGVLGNSDEKFQSRRVLGNASFLAWKFDVTEEQHLWKHWSVYGHLNGQWTLDPLIPNEQLVIGGADSVRGYRESEVAGDRGASASLEIRGYPLGFSQGDATPSLYGEIFADGGQIRLVDPAGPQISLITLASIGLGVHATGWHGLGVAIDAAKTLREGGKGVKGPITPQGTTRIEASLSYNF